jgi:hypothetical protein
MSSILSSTHNTTKEKNNITKKKKKRQEKEIETKISISNELFSEFRQSNISKKKGVPLVINLK